MKMLNKMLIVIAAIVSLFGILSQPVQAWPVHGSAGVTYPTNYPCPQVSQNWCVEANPLSADVGWTTFTPVATGTGACGATGTFTGSCIIYIAEGGTGTLATCRYAANDATLYPSGFSFTIDPTAGGTNNSKACPYQTAYMSGVRANSSDFLLFKRGDCFYDPNTLSPCTGLTSTGTSWGICSATGITCNFNYNGASRAAPIVIGAFGPTANARPRIATVNNCWNVQANIGNYIALLDLDCEGGAVFQNFYSTTYNPGMVTAAAAAVGQQAVTGAINSPSTPGLIRLSMASTANLAGPLYVASVGGVTAANGTWASYTVINSTQVDLVGSTFSGTYTSGGTVGVRQITWPTALPAYINSTTITQWTLYNFSNKTSLSSTSCAPNGLRIASLSGSTLTTTQNIPANWNVSVGDILVLLPAICGNGGIGVSTSTAYNFGYFEGIRVNGSGIGLNPGLNPRFNEIYVRRSVIQDSASVGTRNQGIFVSDSYDASSVVLIEENTTSHTGWRQIDPDCPPGQFLPAKCGGVASEMFYNFYGNPPSQAQGSYDHENSGVAYFRRNIQTNGAGSSIQVRSGGQLYNNFLASSNTGGTGGGIVTSNDATYNVFSNTSVGFLAIITANSVAGNVITSTYVPQAVGNNSNSACQWFNASNPSGINQTTNASWTSTTTQVTIAGPAITVAPGDRLYCVGLGSDYASWGYTFDSTWTNPATVSVNAANPSNVQWNITTGTLSNTYTGGPGGQGFAFSANTARAVGNVFANNWIMNQSSISVQDQTLIVGVGTTAFCGTKIGIFVPKNGVSSAWHAGDSIVISGVAPSSMGANGTWTVDSYNNTDNTPAPVINAAGVICLAGSTFGTGTWTAGTGVINGGIAWSNNHYYNVNLSSLVFSTTIGGTSGATASLSAFIPVTTSGCPQAAGCPTIEGYAITSGIGTTQADFVACAKLNRKGAWDVRCTAALANNHIRQYTDPSIPRPAF